MGEAVLKLRDAATLASLVHEFGHLAHAALESLSQDESAPAVYREMWDATLSWWGVTAEEWAALDFEGRRPLFEQWAETFELWIREGKSPSLALRSVFETLSGWLKAIYRTLAGLPNARLSPDIRDVFERLLASDEEIAQARALSGADIDMSREAFRTDADYQAYRAAEAQTRAALEDKVRARAQEAHTRAGKRAWRVQRETQRAAAQRYVDSDPARRAERWLAFQAWDPLPDTELSEEGEIGYVAPANALETMPADLPEMQLDEAAAAADWPGLNLPPALAFRLDPEAAMAEAMRLKRAGKGKQPARLWAFVKAQGGLSLEGLPQQLREKIEALKLGRKRPGVLNAKTGASAEALMAGAEAAGYFGLTLRGPALRDKAIGQGMELFQQAPPSDKAPSLEEFIDALVADLSDARRVYSANDGGALGAAQNLSDARAWFEDNGVDLSATKETIRAQVEAALAKRSAAPALHPEEIAPWFGFSSGDEMMRALAGLKPRAEAIEARMDEIAAEQWGDPVADGTLREEALEAAHAEAQARKIEIELAAIETAGGGRKSALSARAKEYARSEVEEMSAREVRGLAKFLAGERRAAKDAIAALEKGDVADAALAKSRQLISFWLYHFAAKAGAALDRIEARWGRYSKSSGTRAAIGPKHIAQIDAILDSIETGKPSFRPQETLAEWAEGLKEEGAEDLLIFNPETVAQQIKRPLSSMSVADIRALNDVLANIEAIGRARIKLRKKAEAERVADVVGRLKERIAREWAPQLAKNQSLVAPNTGDKIGREWRMLHARLIKMDYLSRYLDGLKDGGPWMEIMGQVQDAENAEALRNRDAAQGFMELVARHYSKRQFAEMLSKRVYIAAIDDSRTKAQLIAYALNVGNAYNKAALLRGEGWSEATLQAVLAPLETNDRAFVQGLWNYVGQWKEESFALDERTLGSRPPEVLAEPFAWPDGSVSAGGYWPVAFSPERGDLAAQREAKDSVIGVYGAGFRQAATNRGRLKARTGTKGQPLSDDFLGVLARHAADSIRDITHRELVVTLRRVKADKELRAMVARAAGRDAVRALDDWVYRLGSRTPVAPFGTWAALPKYLRRAGTGHAMGFKVSVATLNLLGHLQAIPRNGVIAQMKQAGISVVVGFPDLLARHLKAFATGRKEVSARVAFVHQRSAMMAGRRNSFDRDIADMKGNLTGRREGTLLPIWFEELLMDLNAMTDQAVAVPTWMAAYESALAGKVKGVSGEDAAARYADSVVRMTISAGSRKDLAAMIGSNDEWQRLATMFMGWANTFYNQLTLEQFPGIAQGKISPAKFAANMLWVWLLPAVVTAAWYGHDKRDYDESEEEYWARMGLNAVVYPLGTIPFVRDLSSTLVQGYRPQTPYTAAIDRAAKFASAVERADERQMVKQGYMLAGQTLGLPAQLYVTGDYLADLAAGEEDPAADPADALSEALLRDTR